MDADAWCSTRDWQSAPVKVAYRAGRIQSSGDEPI